MILEECQFKQDAELAGICISIEELPEPTGLKSPDNTTTIWRVKKKKPASTLKQRLLSAASMFIILTLEQES